MYAEKGALLERIEFLEDEIHRLLTEAEQSAEAQENFSPTKREKGRRQDRPSYIPVRIKPKTKTSAQTRFQYALGTKPPEPPGAPPSSRNSKPPEPSIPPPPGVLKSVMRQKETNSQSQSQKEVDVFSSEFSPQKFLDSLRMTHLGDLDLSLPSISASYSSSSRSAPAAPVETSMTSSRIKSKFNGISPSEQKENSPSPSYSSDTNSIGGSNEEWQNAENQRVETRRKIVSPSSAFLPVLDSNKGAGSGAAGGGGGQSDPSKGKAIEIKKNMKKQNLYAPSSGSGPAANDLSFTGSIVNPQKRVQQQQQQQQQGESHFTSVGGIDITAALAKANQIVGKHSHCNVSGSGNNSKNMINSRGLSPGGEERGQSLSSPEGFEAKPQPQDEETPSPSPSTSAFSTNDSGCGNDESAAGAGGWDGGSGVWMMIQDPTSGRYYYYNQETQECTWERPIGEEILQKLDSSSSPKMTLSHEDDHHEEGDDHDYQTEDDQAQDQDTVQSSSQSFDSNHFYYSMNLPAIEEEVEKEEEEEEVQEEEVEIESSPREMFSQLELNQSTTAGGGEGGAETNSLLKSSFASAGSCESASR
jgi:hypothetical protein